LLVAVYQFQLPATGFTIMAGSYKQTVAPTLDPITRDEAKTHCSIAGTTDHDDYIDALIDRATNAIEKRLDRQILSATWTLTLDGFPNEIVIHKPPVSSITSIVYTDTAGDDQTLSTDDYQTDLSTQDGPARIKPVSGVTWPNTKTGTYGTVVVTFVCGYTTAAHVPLALKHAVAFLVAHWFRQREPVITGTTVANMPAGLEMLLSLEDWGGYA